jgi:hypothetical protein
MVSREYSSEARFKIVCRRRRLMKGKFVSTGNPERYMPLCIIAKFMGGTRTANGIGAGADMCAANATKNTNESMEFCRLRLKLLALAGPPFIKPAAVPASRTIRSAQNFLALELPSWQSVSKADPKGRLKCYKIVNKMRLQYPRRPLINEPFLVVAAPSPLLRCIAAALHD